MSFAESPINANLQVADQVNSTPLLKNNRSNVDSRSVRLSSRHSRRPSGTSDYIAKEPRTAASSGSVSVDVGNITTAHSENTLSLVPRLGTDSLRSSDGWLLGGSGGGW